MNVFTVVGARPQFIKALPVSKVFRDRKINEYIVHTGQHYDKNLSKIFFDELGDIEPDVNLMVGSGSHARQTGQMMIDLESLMVAKRPDWVLVYGDTNSTLAGALAAAKLNIPIIHVEAGLRSFNRIMPEEHNRVLTDHCSELLMCPTETARSNLAREGIVRGVHVAGDTMYDSVLHFVEYAGNNSSIVRDLGLTPAKYLLATIHRAENTDNERRLRNIVEALIDQDETVVLPLHPRTKKRITETGLNDRLSDAKCPLMAIDPVGYLDMLALEKNARMILTDSGGVQKEACFLSVPCLTLRDETEWIETVECGWNRVVGTKRDDILASIRSFSPAGAAGDGMFGDGHASEKIVDILQQLSVRHGSVEGRIDR